MQVSTKGNRENGAKRNLFEVWEKDYAMKFLFFMISTLALIGTNLYFGANHVHIQWRNDAIERCAKTHGAEWCVDRATLEKW